MSYKYTEPSVLVGRIASRFEQVGNDRLKIDMEDGTKYAFLHNQDCCENVNIHDVRGDLAALTGSPFTAATKTATGEEWPADVPKSEYCESFTWTTLHFETTKGAVTVRWIGESNGHYGEGVDMEELA